MNEFVAKKLGEVHAFIYLVDDTYTRGQKGFATILPTSQLDAAHAELTSIRGRIETIAKAQHMHDVVVTKSDRTLAKITAARDAYIDGRWDDTVELYEWSSFNGGAGSAHAHEVFGAAIALKDTELAETASEARDVFDALLADAKDYLYKTGTIRAKES